MTVVYSLWYSHSRELRTWHWGCGSSSSTSGAFCSGSAVSEVTREGRG